MLKSTETPAKSVQIADGGILEINLPAIVRNWQAVSTPLRSGCRASAVVKANAYGLGALPVSLALYDAGCRDFFVALLQEALELRDHLPADAKIYVFDGLRSGTEKRCQECNIIPVIFTLKQLAAWKEAGAGPCVIKADTGMTRLGFDMDVLLENIEQIVQIEPVMIMSHLACAEDAANEQNKLQLKRFLSLRDAMVGRLPNTEYSLCNSSGIFLGGDYHFDCVRPGCALYGVNPTPNNPSPVESVVSLRLPIAQLRQAQAGESVGYGGTHVLKKDALLAVALGGYADGVFRSLSNRLVGVVNGQRVPLVGRVSMDTLVFDVTGVDGALVEDESYIELLGNDVGVDELAEAAGTIGYEVLTGLGSRYQRHYIQP